LVQQRAFGTALVQAYATNTWTANGQIASVYDADGPTHVTNYTYDGFDRLSITAFADSVVGHLDLEQIARYDADNNPLVRITRGAQIVNYAYDALDRVCIKVMTAPNITPPTDCHATAQPSPAVTSFSTYDLLNRATGATDTNGNTLANVYDNANRMTSATRTTPLLSAKTVSYAYDPAGNRTQMTWPDGYYAQYTYDALNHPVTVIDSGSATLATYIYDTLARRTGLQYNGATGAKMQYAWSTEDDFVTLSSDLAVGGNLAATTNDVAFAHSFTPAHQWATATISNPAFRYLPTTTVTTPYAVANVLNQYGTVGGVVQTYDTRGNLTSDGARTYTYDTENRMLTATASGLSAAYAYDPMGRRTAKTVNSTVTAFVHDGDSEIAEYDGSGALQRRYVPGPAIDEYIAMVTAAGVKSYFHTDKMGSVIAMSDASGNLTEGPYTYDSYGNCFSGGVACGAGLPFRFTGQRLDPETGLYFYRARYYASKDGRFLQTDGVGYKADLNLYTYAGNDPTDGTDPSGNCPPQVCGDGANLNVGNTGGGNRLMFAAGGLVGGEPEGSAAGGNPNSLSFVTVSGGPGQKSWRGKFVLSNPSPKGGHVVQKVETNLTETTPDGKIRIYPLPTIWEGWPVLPGHIWAGRANNEGYHDDFLFKNVTFPNKLTTTVTGTARFYEGLTDLPPTFHSGYPPGHAGSLKSTTIDPHLPLDNATAPLIRTDTYENPQ
jgi:RHS repeat-associated protein